MSASEDAKKEQRLGADPAYNVFVTANAGSGKTKVLVDRIARLLLTAGADPASFLCVTYTTAAAAEMQRRLFEQLGEWSVMADERLAKQLLDLHGGPEPGPDQLARARALFARALETPGGLKIQTIHAFCQRLLARFPLEAGVAPGFEIADDGVCAELRAEALAAASEDAAFARLAARLDIERLDTLTKRLLSERAQIERFISAAGGEAGALDRLAQRHGRPRPKEEALAAVIEGAPWGRLQEAAQALATGGTKAQEIAALIGAAAQSRDPNAYFAIFCTQKGTLRANPVPKAVEARAPWLPGFFAEEGARACALRDEAKAAERLADSAAALLLGAAAAAQYHAAKTRRGALDFEDLILAGERLLTAGEAAAWVLYKLDGGLDHILIDEGQDTSPAQWSLIAPLQEEFFAGEGARTMHRTVFAVGDPKQSIYSFQGADPARFLLESQRLSKRAFAAGRPFESPSLATSFRSTPEVLQAVDATFANVDVGGGEPDRYNKIEHLPFREGQTGLVEWWPIAPHPEKADPSPWDAPLDRQRADSAVALLCDTLAERVTQWIATGEAVWDKSTGRLRPMRPGDVLALVRSRGSCFEQLLKAFKRRGLPVAGADRLILKEDIAVEDLLAAARTALDPEDDLSLACLLKSPLVGLCDDDRDLFPLAHDRAPGERLIDRLRETRDPRFAEARDFVERVIASSQRAPYDFFAGILEGLDGSGRSGWRRMFARLGPDARDPIEELLARALAAPARGHPSLTGFICAIEADDSDLKRQMDEAGDAVRIMTVHGAKGLEAPVVLLPDTVDGPPGRPKDGLFVGEEGLVFSPSDAEDDAAARAAAEAAAERAEQEHLRLLYVALTRPRDRLIVCGHAKGNGEGAAKDGSWHRLVQTALARVGEPCETPFGPGHRLGRALTAPLADAPALRSALPAWAERPASEAAAPERVRPSGAQAPRRFGGLGARQAALRRGTVLHGLLERLPDVAPADREVMGRAWLMRQGLADGAEEALAEALAVLAHPDFAGAFGPGSRAEAPIVGSVFGRRVTGSVDRLRITPSEALIIDYKTNRPVPPPDRPPEAYVLQMALYRAVLAQAFPDRPVRSALLWTHAPRLDALDEALLTGALDALR